MVLATCFYCEVASAAGSVDNVVEVAALIRRTHRRIPPLLNLRHNLGPSHHTLLLLNILQILLHNPILRQLLLLMFFIHNMRGHRCQQPLFILLLFLLLLLVMHIRIYLLFVYHTHLLFPYCGGYLLQLLVYFFKVVAVLCNACLPRVCRIYPLKIAARQVLLN